MEQPLWGRMGSWKILRYYCQPLLFFSKEFFLGLDHLLSLLVSSCGLDNLTWRRPDSMFVLSISALVDVGRSWQICQCQVDKNKTRSGPWILLNSDSSWRFAEFLHPRILRFPCLPRMIVKMVRRSSYGSYSCFGCFFCAIPSFSLESGRFSPKMSQ
jgi:hypothetical protein